MELHVELFGIPRQRCGVSAVRLPLAGSSACLAEVLSAMGRQFPDFAEACLDGGRLRSEYSANIGGERFVTDLQTRLTAADCLLIMSADAGG